MSNSARAHIWHDCCTRPSVVSGSARPVELSLTHLVFAPARGDNFPECSLDAEGFSVRHLEICTLLAKERADFDLVVSDHARGERTLRKTRASATSEKSRIQLGTWQPRNGTDQ